MKITRIKEKNRLHTFKDSTKYGQYQVILTTTNYANFSFLLLYLLEKYLHI